MRQLLLLQLVRLPLQLLLLTTSTHYLQDDVSTCDCGGWGMGIGMIDKCGAYCFSPLVWSCGLLRDVVCWARARLIQTLAPLGATMRATIVAALIASRRREPGSCCLTATDARLQSEPTSPTTITAKVGPPAAGEFAAETIARGCGAPVTEKEFAEQAGMSIWEKTARDE